MGPLASSIISGVFLLAGAVALYTMFSIQGGRKVSNPRVVILIHKTAGWLFVLLFLVMFVFMLERVEDYWEESAARIALHVALAVALLLLLAVKVLVARFFKGLNRNLFTLGVLVYLTAFTLVGITGGYYLMRLASKAPYISHARLSEKMYDERLGKELFITKCSTCHSLDRIMAPRSIESWEKVVNDMVAIADPRIKPDEADQILYYLTHTHVPKPYEGTGEATLVDKHCLPCHSAPDIYMNHYNRTGWTEIVQQMNKYDPEIVPADKIGEIVDYLLQNQATHEADSAVSK
jgi:hypothetical protein